MAKVQPSAMVGDARGKIGGHVHTKNRFGMVVRKKVSPVQPRSGPQRVVRSGFTQASKDWTALLTNSQRAAWDSFARNNPVKDVFGNTVILTGHQMYVRLNRVIVRAGGTAIDVPPLSLSIAEPLSVTPTAAHGTPGTLSIAVTNPPTGTECPEIWAAAPQNAGRKFIGSKYRLLGIAAAAAPGPYSYGGEYELRFGTIQVGQIIHVLVKYGNKATGAQGMGLEASCTAT
jgi:hypothetical protein